MSLKDTFKQLKTLLAEVSGDLDKSENGNKAAAQRVRTGTIKLEKVAKLFRKESIKGEKSGAFKKPKAKKSGSAKASPAKSSPSKASAKGKKGAKAAPKAKAAASKAPAKASSGSKAKTKSALVRKKPTAKILKKTSK